MAIRELKRLFSFMLLIEVFSIIFVPFLGKFEFSTSNSFTYSNKTATKCHIASIFIIKGHVGMPQNHRDRFQTIFKETSAALRSGFLYLDSDYHQYNLSAERLTNLMLFPYHSFW